MFSLHTTLEEFKNAEIPVILSYFGFVFKENSGQGNHMIIFWASFSVHTKTKSQRFQIPPVCVQSFFEKLRFRDGFVWTVGGQWNFQIPSACSVDVPKNVCVGG